MPGNAIAVTVAEEHGVLVVRPAGELVWETVADWRSWLDGHVAGDSGVPVLVDLSALTFLDSAGISSLLSTSERLRQAGVPMAFTQPAPLVRQWLRITGLYAHLPIFDTVEAALPAVRPPQ
ncbi:STAS domain-containing protein [Nonomuraea fuscirosea]|uniref:STAS domain-containing protein n=1 Tax=Nonomuraea fuscirosea TaxID=1291556 RepID=UPI002DDC66DF|nr:STAS domain-containing protein [Nonomuraea fuscirosea]WSA56558.1 STAS domain-containing protein [Nonomuraea fuscirosea]